MAVDHNNPQSRNEEILIATIDGNEYDKFPQSRMEELLLELKETIEEGGGGGGTTNYENLSNQPQVNGETLIGDKTGAELGLVDAEEGKGLSTNDYDDTEKAAVAAATSAISAMKDGTDLDSFGDVEVALLDKADTADLGTAATKDSTNSVTSGSTDLVESGAVKDAIDAAVSAAYHHAGTKTVAQLTHDLLVVANEGNVYNITDSGTTTSDFIEGIGKTIDEGSNVGICKVGNTYMFDLLSGFVDTANFVQKSQTAGLLKNDGAVDTTIQGDVDLLKSGLTDLTDHVDGDATTYPYADVITVSDAVPANLADCSVKVEPVQDLHGYNKPWVGGANDNKVPNTKYNGVIGSNGSYSSANNRICNDNTDYTSTMKLSAGTYTINIEGLNQCTVLTKNSNNQIVDNFADSWHNMPYTFTLTEEAFLYYSARKSNNDDISPDDYNTMVVVGETSKSYTPYSNICPISGHAEAVVTRDGKNWFNKNAVGIAVGKYLNSETGELVNSTNNWNTSEYIYVGGLGGESITFSGLNSIGASNFSVCYYDKNNSFISGTNGKVMTLTIPSDERIAYLRFDYRQVDVDDVQLELGSTATPYEPYAGQQYTLALGNTIYGGTVDFDSGVMTVDRVGVDMGALTWTYHPASELFTEFFDTNLPNDSIIGDSEIAANIISPLYKTIPSKDIAKDGYDNGVQALARESRRFITCDKRFSNATDYTNAVDGSILVYELATQFTIQLTPQQIQLLQGTNTLYASTGDISVTVNGVSGAIGAVQEQVNELAGDVTDVQSNLLNLNGYIKSFNSAESSEKVLRIVTEYAKQPVMISIVNNGALAFGMVTAAHGFIGSGNPTVIYDSATLTIGITLSAYAGDVLLMSTRDFTYSVVNPS